MKTDLKIRPIGDRVLVRPIETKNEQKTASGIILPGKENELKHERGQVIATGPGRTSTDGSRVKMEVRKGDIVFYRPGFDNETITLGGEKLILTFETNLLAVEL